MKTKAFTTFSLFEPHRDRTRARALSSGYEYGKLSPMSNYATSDLGSSPRSSISVTSANLAPWMVFRENHKSSFDLDDGASDVCSKDLLSPGMMLSPAPYSPFSDCEDTGTPYSAYARSPTLSPNPLTRSFNHFSFDQIRSSSSMSGRHNLMVPESHSLDVESRERSRSDSDMAPKEERMDTSLQSTISESEIDDSDLRSVSRLASRQPTIEEPPPSPPHELTRENVMLYRIRHSFTSIPATSRVTIRPCSGAKSTTSRPTYGPPTSSSIVEAEHGGCCRWAWCRACERCYIVAAKSIRIRRKP
ncbi:hypothetical protein TELCIR_11534 [Teladorsagia circumcincta]|uniref:Uncharacterized protein n=1 Tax=Teladorsagia circumcincta TaxID=45464 RepID=A0A2G9U912_TELCI|nr:hypothetical protein TELCIR_11534 [Teladorsagia circumcincta]